MGIGAVEGEGKVRTRVRRTELGRKRESYKMRKRKEEWGRNSTHRHLK
jgi:hypothetical protein